MRFGFFLLVLFPITELAILIKIGGLIGVLPTLAIIFATASAGLYLMRRESFSTLARAQQRMASGEIPATEMMEGLLIAFCGALLLAPGFITDTIALLGLIPPIRQRLVKWFISSGKIQGMVSGGVYGFTGTGGFHEQPSTGSPHVTNRYDPGTGKGDIIEGECRREK